MNKEELLYNEIYERTKDFGRTQFVRELMRLQRENKELQQKVNQLETNRDEAIERCDYYLSFETNDGLIESVVQEIKDSLLNEYNKDEIWKDIPEYEGVYQVSNLGRIRSLDREITYANRKTGLYKGRIMKLKMSKYGYVVFHFSVDNKKKAISVHRLVAETFIPNPDNKPCVNHIDCNRANNKVSNLEWCTHKENVQHSIKCGTFGGFRKRERGKE